MRKLDNCVHVFIPVRWLVDFKVYGTLTHVFICFTDLSREFIRDLLEVEQIPLNEHQQKLIEDKIKGFYRRIIDHPALTNDRVIFAPKHPDFQHLIPDDSRELSYPSDRLVSTLQNEQHSCPEPLRDLSKEDDDSYVTTSYPSLASYTWYALTSAVRARFA